MHCREGPCSHPSLPGVIIEDVLDALAMVDIPVDNKNPKFRPYWRAPCRCHTRSPSRCGGSKVGILATNSTSASLACVPSTYIPLQPIFLLGMFGCYSHIVEHTESIGSLLLTVVPWRSEVQNWDTGHVGVILSPHRVTHSQFEVGQFSPHQGKPIVHSSC